MKNLNEKHAQPSLLVEHILQDWHCKDLFYYHDTCPQPTCDNEKLTYFEFTFHYKSTIYSRCFHRIQFSEILLLRYIAMNTQIV